MRSTDNGGICKFSRNACIQDECLKDKLNYINFLKLYEMWIRKLYLWTFILSMNIYCTRICRQWSRIFSKLYTFFVNFIRHIKKYVGKTQHSVCVCACVRSHVCVCKKILLSSNYIHQFKLLNIFYLIVEWIGTFTIKVEM